MYLLLKEELEEIKNNKEILSDEELSSIQVTQPSEEQLNIVKHEAIIGDNRLSRINITLESVIDILYHVISILAIFIIYEVLMYCSLFWPEGVEFANGITKVLILAKAISIILYIIYYAFCNEESTFRKAFAKGEFEVINAEYVGSVLSTDKIGMLCKTVIKINDKHTIINSKIVNLSDRVFIAKILMKSRNKYCYKVVMY